MKRELSKRNNILPINMARIGISEEGL